MSTRLADFVVDRRMLLIAALAVPIGALSAGAAWCLLRLIALVTNLVFYQRWAVDLVAPGAQHHPWWLVLGAPVAGGLVVGVMARLGSEKIRGHGMPEAIEAILTQGSRVEPKVAVLKPVSAAISIGTGGPFGAEGPIIMTGGALGSILAQHLHLTADERKILLVSGAAGGMAATFNSPLASILLAVELLLFEWRPRSLVPVAAAVAVATVVRQFILGGDPMFPVDAHIAQIALENRPVGTCHGCVRCRCSYRCHAVGVPVRGCFFAFAYPLDVVARDRRHRDRARRADRATRTGRRLRRN